VAQHCLDWRRVCAPADVAGLITREAGAWRRELEWDVRESWSGLEPARASGRLSGRVLTGNGSQRPGWACFVVHRQTLQIAILVADTVEATETLVASILASDEAARASSIAICVRAAAPGLEASLRACGMRVVRYRYLTRRIDAATGQRPSGRPWRTGDEPRIARLLADAYRTSRSVRAFAPHDTSEEWLDYVAALTGGDGCGRLMPSASFVWPTHASETSTFDAAVLTTRLSEHTAHIAQLAVAPQARRGGLAGALVESAAGNAQRLGCSRLTLLVADDNEPARLLYERLGFSESAAFVVGLRRQPS
jgi:ribosomal protein S18 acetylase RimI-like enzyme